MKRQLFRRKHGVAFTLVELLVVLGIIAILIGVIVASVSSVLRFAKRTKANANAVQIQTAVMSYYQEYGVYPTVSGAAAGYAYYSGTDVNDWENLMRALCGNVNAYNPSTAVVPTVSNTRGIAYLQPTRSDLDANGIILNPFGSSATSTYFYMAIDTDYSGVVGDSGGALNKLPDFTHYATNYTGATLATGIPGGVAVWCPCDQPVGGGTPPSHLSPPSFWAHTY
jgi:type II secretory pathway pseudopilin PulG